MFHHHNLTLHSPPPAATIPTTEKNSGIDKHIALQSSPDSRDESAVQSVVLVCDRTSTGSYRTSTISYNVFQGYSESLVSFSCFIKTILKFQFFLLRLF